MGRDLLPNTLSIRKHNLQLFAKLLTQLYKQTAKCLDYELYSSGRIRYTTHMYLPMYLPTLLVNPLNGYFREFKWTF